MLSGKSEQSLKGSARRFNIAISQALPHYICKATHSARTIDRVPLYSQGLSYHIKNTFILSQFLRLFGSAGNNNIMEDSIFLPAPWGSTIFLFDVIKTQ